MEDNSELIKLLFAELVSELGGVVRLDSQKIMDNVNKKKFKEIGISMEGPIAVVEVFEDEDEN